MVNGAARKLPVPAPEWFEEVRRFDYRQRLLAAYQMEAWSMARAMEVGPMFNLITAKTRVPEPFVTPVNFAMIPYGAFEGGDYAAAMHRVALELEKSRRCGFDAASVNRRFSDSLAWWNTYGREVQPDFELWQRLARFEAELEGTAKVLELKRLHWPQAVSDIAESQCSDGTWRYQPRTLEFSEQIPKEKGDSIAYPLRYTY